ncbi:Bug family tripartite tricarboxylate transporter substrate binding protein [Pseudoclavibacter sp. VKM Ac-2867]|uniref:Bug family tripartite tricarboxylate transporter substrate binding protein n=1 Tax=Pseudoclavibacter sp. VKM Ac-2867 TaxID=2783829 RepID=UPI00188A0322|nr:tripartite tricarboxylate transporter substrate binding protein [Pseudoclavibacter sp. VKM Ac-2867]MBF4457659.1 tripartite tricarboxylate transporter substrate binding protein [Pseudoclavibacter sp. VKM Ac-2867]
MSKTPRSTLGRVVNVVVGVCAVAIVASATALSISRSSAAEDVSANLTLIAPAGPGGGWDGFAREQQQALRATGLVGNVQVVNIPGAAGTIGLGTFTTMTGRSDTLLVTGSGMTGGIALNDSPVGFDDVRPVAKFAEDYDVIIVPADSPHTTLQELVDAWAADPKSIPWSGGSAGTIDHLLIAELAQAAGIPPAELTYIPKSGGGEAIQALLNGTVDAVATGYNDVSDQIEAGRVRALAVSGAEELEGVDIPTIMSQGYDVEVANWRGLLAAPGVSDEAFQQQLEIFSELRESDEWQEVLTRLSWEDSWLTGPELDAFLVEDMARTEALLEELGL